MNLRQPYEQVIADKLRQLRPPDADASWQQMKRLLDDEEERGAGGKRPPGNNGWWRIGLLAIVLISSTWLFLEQKEPTNNNLAAVKTTTAKPENASTTASATNNNKPQTQSIENNTTLKTTDSKDNVVASSNNATTTNANSTSEVAAGNDANNVSTKTKENTVAADNKTNKKLSAANNNNLSAGAGLTSDAKKAGSNNAEGLTVNNNNNHLAPHKVIANTANDLPSNNPEDLAINKSSSTRIKNKNNKPENANAVDAITVGSIDDVNTFSSTGNNGLLKQKNTSNKGKNGKANSWLNNDAAGASTNNTIDYIAVQPTAKQKTWFERLTELKQPVEKPTYSTDALADDSIASNKKIELSADAKKAVAKAKRDNEIELLDKKDKKSLHLNLSNLFKPFSMRMDAEPWWAAGLAVNGNIPLSSQNRFNYSMNAKSGTLTDYIPSPYLQFHLNNYVYFQTELNFVSPQFTPQLLAFRQSNDITAQAGMSEQKSIFIQKMYYFNWPVSLHYSPVSNLYFSAGIQFSSFQSGLAAIESKQYATTLGVDHPSSTYTDVLKFKDDSIAAKIAPNEWRWQVGAEYYINRFSVGLRYNQSFKNAVNSPAAPNLAPTVFRNQSMLFFIRYNLFESRNKESVPKNQ